MVLASNEILDILNCLHHRHMTATEFLLAVIECEDIRQHPVAANALRGTGQLLEVQQKDRAPL